MGSATSLLGLALSTTCDEFVAACPFPFLVGDADLKRPPGGSWVDDEEDITSTVLIGGAPGQRDSLVIAIRKLKPAKKGEITVGRDRDNDVMIDDVEISKLHALFTVAGERVELQDAGSRNGTWVNQEKLDPRGLMVRVAPGDAVRFAKISFRMMTPGALWEHLRKGQWK